MIISFGKVLSDHVLLLLMVLGHNHWHIAIVVLNRGDITCSQDVRGSLRLKLTLLVFLLLFLTEHHMGLLGSLLLLLRRLVLLDQGVIVML